MTWTEVSFGVRPSHAETAIGIILRLVPQGLSESGRGRRVLRVYLPRSGHGRRVFRALARELRAAGFAPHVATRPISQAAWQDAWRVHARPVRIGRLAVLPTWWKAAAGATAVVVRIDPGMAFGSGEHPTTHLCLAAIERHLTPGATVIDIGTGSGILAIAAARLGARRVLALDNDPVAVAVARQNVAANRVTSRVRVIRADRLGPAVAPAHLIVANLTADTLAPFLCDAHRCLRPGGRLVASGFTAAREADVSRAVAAVGLRRVAIMRRRGWSALHAIRD
ncbi:MAG: 50S ribosomal protein L11 methyltransferase [Armatimonadota bacterium]|nr:50S ribosomal protein L11 methyltransferase [Armatimonadota bacterium]